MYSTPEKYAAHMRLVSDIEKREGHGRDSISIVGKNIMKLSREGLSLLREKVEAETRGDILDEQEKSYKQQIEENEAIWGKMVKEGAWEFAAMSLGNGLMGLSETLQNGVFSPADFAARFTFYTTGLFLPDFTSAYAMVEDEVIEPFKLAQMRRLEQVDGSLASHFENPAFLPNRLKEWTEWFYPKEFATVVLPLYESQAVRFSHEERNAELLKVRQKHLLHK